METLEKHKVTKNRKDSLKTELSLGLPGSESPERKHHVVTIFGKDFDEEQNTTLQQQQLITSNSNSNNKGCNKRVFCDVIEKWALCINNNGGHNGHFTQVEKNLSVANSEQHCVAPAPKAQVVGWPPIRSFRKNTMASTSSKNNGSTQEKSVSECLYVKVSMDGAPYLRKVDLRNYRDYKELSSALEKMFTCFISGQYGAHGHGKHDEKEGRTSEYVLTYEDKDDDWMLVGDVPWKMFMENCRKLRIMKGSEAIGLAPSAVEKCKNQG
ncbi:hypothetical protein vseg_020787 [Gypsophila vaccaria]